MGRRTYPTQHSQTVQQAFKKAKISVSVYRGGALTTYELIPDLLISAVTGQLIKAGWYHEVHKKTLKLPPAERCGIKRFIGHLNDESFLDCFFMQPPQVSAKQEEILRRQLKSSGWNYQVQTEIYRDRLGNEYGLRAFNEQELSILSKMMNEYRFADDWMDFHLKASHAAKQYAKKEAGPDWHSHPLVKIYHDLQTNIRIRDREIAAEESEMVVDNISKKITNLESLVRQSA